MSPELTGSTARKLTELKRIISKTGKDAGILIAYSGGVDSSVLAAVASEVLANGNGVRCVLVDSEMLPRSERAAAERIAASLGVESHVIEYSKLNDPVVAANPTDRCYHCKKAIAEKMMELKEKLGSGAMADGVNTSDFGEHRPGITATDEAGFIHPFVEAGMTKADIREVARYMNLPFAEKPSMACLSSRIPYGEEITREKLERIEKAEDYFRERGYDIVRVRHPGGAARIELGPEEMNRFRGDIEFMEEATAHLKSLGFVYISLDLEPYRSGSMDAVL